MALLQISEPGKTQAPHEKKFFIGIDLGTTNSLVALIQNGSPTVLTDVNEKELFPSIVQYKNDGTVVACCESEQDNLLTFRSAIVTGSKLSEFLLVALIFFLK